METFLSRRQPRHQRALGCRGEAPSDQLVPLYAYLGDNIHRSSTQEALRILELELRVVHSALDSCRGRLSLLTIAVVGQGKRVEVKPLSKNFVRGYYKGRTRPVGVAVGYLIYRRGLAR